MAKTAIREKLLQVSALWQALDDAGIAKFSYARKWLKLQEDKGNLVYPSAGAYERRKFTQKQIEEIVDAFLPGGAHSWIWPGESHS